MKSTLIIACGAIANELATLRRLNGWGHVDIRCLPPELHNTPSRIPVAVEAELAAAAGKYRQLYVAYADCGTGGRLDALLDPHGIQRLPGAHCYEFFAGADAFRRLADAELGTFYVTDFLVRNFDRLVVGTLGLDRHPELLETYFGNYRRLLYLAQIESTELETAARHCARRLGLEYQREFTGLEPLAHTLRPLAGAAIEWRN